jgi:hypothetical protein
MRCVVSGVSGTSFAAGWAGGLFVFAGFFFEFCGPLFPAAFFPAAGVPVAPSFFGEVGAVLWEIPNWTARNTRRKIFKKMPPNLAKKGHLVEQKASQIIS